MIKPFQTRLKFTEATPLLDLDSLAQQFGVARVLMKAENHRALGNFKSLGGMQAGLRALERERRRRIECGEAKTGLPLTLICASDGNHGLAVAAAARTAKARARIYLPASVPPDRTARIAVMGAEIVRVSGTYDEAVDEARLAASSGQGLLIADTTDEADDPVVADVMEGYATVATEVVAQLRSQDLPPPTHLFVQAGVGGLAAAMAEGLVEHMAPPRRVIVVEPETAACVALGLTQGRPSQLAGDLETCADMLSCGLASAPALRTLLHYRADAIAVSEAALRDAPDIMQRAGGPTTTPSGAAGLAGLILASENPEDRMRLGLDGRSSVLLFVTEGIISDGRLDRPEMGSSDRRPGW